MGSVMEFKSPKKEPEDDPTTHRHTPTGDSDPSKERTNVTKDAATDFSHQIKHEIDVESRYHEEMQGRAGKESIKADYEEQRNETSRDNIDYRQPPKLEIDMESRYMEVKRSRSDEGQESTVKTELQLLQYKKLKVNQGGSDQVSANRATANTSNPTLEIPTAVPHEKASVEKCPHCSLCYAAPVKIEKHIRICRSRPKEFPCPQCPSSFTLKDSLDRHERSVHQETRFKCPECEKEFSQKVHLSAHRRIHTGEKPFKCSQCDDSFTTSGALASHLLIHTGQNPHVCTLCELGFRQSSSLRSHVKRSHDPSKANFPCVHCSCAFATKQAVSQHTTKIHY